MKRKITFLIAVLCAVMLVTQSFTAKGQTRSDYTITFKSNSNDTDSGSSLSGSSSVSDAVSSGDSYVSSIEDAAYAYPAKNSIGGLKFGNSSNTGYIEFNLSSTGSVKATKITINARRYNDKTCSVKITINGSTNKTIALTSTTLSDYDWEFSTTDITTIKIESVEGTGSQKDKRIYVKSIKVTYTADPTITIGSPSGGTIDVTKTSDGSNISTGLIASGTGITLNATPSTGYAFYTWNVTKTSDGTAVSLNSAATVASNSFSMPNYNTTVNATFTKQSYNVTLGTPADVVLTATDMNEINIAEGETESVPYGTELVLEAGSMASGKMFAWSVTKTSGGDDVTAAVLSSVTATDAVLTVPDYAVTVSGTVQELKYIVTYKANGGVGSDVVEYYSPGTNVTVADNAFTYSGHVFKTWNDQDDGEGTNYAEGATISSIAADVTLYAQWADAWTVTLNSNAVETINEVEKTHSISLTAPANVPSGYVYKGWTATPSSPNDMVSTTYTPTANVTLYAVFAKTVQEYTEKTVILKGSVIGSTVYTSSITKTSDGISYTFCPNGKDNKVQRQLVPSTASNEFPGLDSTILIGKNGAYIKNNTAFGEGIIDFDIYENKGAAGSVDVGINFSSSTVASYNESSPNTWTGTMTPDNVYSAKASLPAAPSRAKYFWFQVTSSANVQVAFRITYIAPVYYTRIYPSGTTNASEDITISSPTVIQSGTVLNMGSYDLTNTTAANLIIEDGGQLILAKTNTGVAATVKKDVYAATAGSKTDATHWYAISAGVENPSITGNTNIITGGGSPTYDLYRLNEEKNAGDAWENYRNALYSTSFTTLEKGRGYLYRNASDLTITMTGDINVEDFTYNVTKTGSGEYAGFNLIGNPYTHDIYKGAGTAITDGTSNLSTGFYYLEPSTGKWAKGTDKSTPIAPNQGILVQVNTTGNINMTNTNSNGSAKSNNDYIMLSVANSQYSDEAYAWFDKGIGLNKIEHRNSEIPMLYINQNDENFAIATMSDETQSFNLNFKAAAMGKYTLSYKAKGDYNYLHVIDRLTGEDVDMLLEGEYSFIASPIDSENRFIVRLEYSAGSEISESSVFAYQSGNDIIVNGEGELQIFDMMGRRVSTQYVSGVETINLQSHGVYIFKLNEKTQKIVVK